VTVDIWRQAGTAQVAVGRTQGPALVEVTVRQEVGPVVVRMVVVAEMGLERRRRMRKMAGMSVENCMVNEMSV